MSIPPAKLLNSKGILSMICLRLWLMLFAASPSVIAQSPVFTHFTVDNGLPQNSVNCIIQDKQGFMWFGTQDGLCRFDGYKFKTYRHDPHKNSISNNYIWNIYEDKEGIFWITTFGGGLNRFDPATETFKQYKREKEIATTLSSNNTFVLQEVNNILWIGTNDGFCSLDKKTGRIKRYLQTPGNEKDIAGNHIGTITYQQPGFLWLNSDSGLTRFNLQSEKIDFFGEKIFNCPFSIKRIMQIKSFGDKLLIACDTGLVELDIIKQTGSILLNSSEVKAERKPGFTGVLSAPGGKYWIKTSQGLLIFDSQLKQHTLYQHKTAEPGSLTHNNVLSIFRSPSGVFWIGTRNGLNKLDREQNEFFLLKSVPDQKNTLSHKNVSSIAEDNNGLIWIGTSDGLNAFDRKDKNITVFKPDSLNKNSLSSGYILSLLKDDDGNLWVGTRSGGLNKLLPGKDILSAKFQQFKLDNKTIQHICKGDSNILWLGSSGGSLIRFNKRTGETKAYPWKQDGTGPSHPFIYYIFKDSFGNIWLGTPTGGLNLFDPFKERFIYIKNESSNFNSLSNNIVLTIFEDKDRRLWVGTSGGLNRLIIPLQPNLFAHFEKNVNPEKDSLFVRYGIADGLPNDVIYGILQDNKGSFWLTTNNGLAKFSLSGSKPVIKTYDVKDGIQNNEFNQNTYYKNTKGELYFGGVDGFNIFHPDSLKGNKEVPRVVITDFKLYNESVMVGDKGKYNFSLKRSIAYTDEIKLAYHHKVVTFEFAALNYINTEKNQYQYKLENFDKDWVDAGENRSATYTNLDPGSYTFHVRASNNDGVWNENGAFVRLTVPPPPWLSWYAYLGYFLIILFAVYYFINQRIRRTKRKFETNAAIEKAKVEARESFRRKSSQDFHDEAGNKITKINLFTELAKSEAENNPALINYLDKIYQNTAELSSGMRDFIWALDPEKDTIFDTIMRLKEFGDSMFTEAGINFTLTGLQPEFNYISLPMDTRRTVIQVFKEAMNNCAKHAKATTIFLSVNVSGSEIEIRLQDNGKGFNLSDENNFKGYGTRIMKERAEKTGAQFSITSQLEKGTEVRLCYNIPQLGD